MTTARTGGVGEGARTADGARVDGRVGQAAEGGVAGAAVEAGLHPGARVEEDAHVVVAVDEGNLQRTAALVVLQQRVGVRVGEQHRDHLGVAVLTGAHQRR